MTRQKTGSSKLSNEDKSNCHLVVAFYFGTGKMAFFANPALVISAFPAAFLQSPIGVIS